MCLSFVSKLVLLLMDLQALEIPGGVSPKIRWSGKHRLLYEFNFIVLINGLLTIFGVHAMFSISNRTLNGKL